ncbi:flagellar motor switch phosphatase FliY [Caproiciproducens sp. NJN-50]|nr:flagellar motor switch phosphatase FliY [Caproiciproducens sp. NJN-50]QAT51347.1 flagellar motor switch phosphatase FliY [Caproiciproducens sp. NJN-50]
MEIDAIGEILNISLGSSATSVSELLGQPVNITTPEVKLMKTSEFDIKTYEPAIAVEINYVQGLSGKNLLILKESDVKVIVGLLLQTDFSDQEFVMDEMNVGAICEVMNQMMGAAATALSQFLNRSINISPPNSFSIDNSEKFKEKYFEGNEDIVAVYFNLMIGNMINSQFINVMPISLAKELVSNFGLDSAQRENAAAPSPEAPVHAPAASQPVPPPEPQPAGETAPPQQPGPQPAPTAASAPPAPSELNIRNAAYPSFDEPEPPLTKGESNNLNMILSVPLQITVEIGRTSKKIKEILDFSTGTIVELNKQAGSQVDVFVNGQAIAKGNVVVVDDFYGVRITEVMNSEEIMKLV